MNRKYKSVRTSDIKNFYNVLTIKSRKQTMGQLIKRILFVMASCSIFIVLMQIIFLLREASGILKYVSIKEFLFGTEWFPTDDANPRFGALPLILGTLFTTFGSMIISVPIGIMCAVYISELAPVKIKNILKSIVELLSGIPSVIFGLFGMIIISPWITNTFNRPSGASWLNASLILAIMSLPTIISVSEDALRSVPNTFREASLGVGANKWQTISDIILPSASSGITTSIIMGMGRAIGETMAVIMIAGNIALIPEPISNIFYPIRTMTATVAIEMPEIVQGDAHYNVLFALVILLFFVIITLNLIAEKILANMNKRFNPTNEEKNHLKSNKILKKIAQIKSILKNKVINPIKSIYKNHSKLYKRIIIYGLLFIVFMQWNMNAASLKNQAIFTLLAFIIIFVVVDLIYLKSGVVRKQKIAFILIYISITLVLLSLLSIIGFVVVRGVKVISWDFITSPPLDSGRAGGILPAIAGSLYLMIGAIFISVPLGIGAGIYLAEYAKEGKFVKFIRTCIDNLNGTPSIVFGLFGMVVFCQMFGWHKSLLAGMFTLSLMILPTIIRTTEQSIMQVSPTLKEASLGLGATKWETIRKIIIPSSGPGIMTGIVLAMGRAIGECAPILFTAVVFSRSESTLEFMEPMMALPYHIYKMTSYTTGGADMAYGTALVLLVLVIFFYSIAMVLRKKINKKLMKTFSY